MKSDTMKKHIDKEQFNSNLKKMDGDQMDDIEYQIAEKIITDY